LKGYGTIHIFGTIDTKDPSDTLVGALNVKRKSSKMEDNQEEARSGGAILANERTDMCEATKSTFTISYIYYKHGLGLNFALGIRLAVWLRLGLK
jgi:hypothetical protein